MTVEEIVQQMSQPGLSDDAYKKLFMMACELEKRTQDDYLQYLIGLCYQVGRGVDIDAKQSFSYYMKSAKQGNAQAMYTVGLCYEHAMGVEENINEAVEWYYKANELGHVDAMFQLGYLYMFAVEDNPQAFAYGVECMRCAAENGHKQAKEIVDVLNEQALHVTE